MPGVGVLKLVDQRHRKLLANGVSQAAIRRLQRVVQLLQQVGKIELRQPGFGLPVGGAHLKGRVGEQQLGHLGFRVKVVTQGLDVGKSDVLVGLAPALFQQGRA